MPSLCSLLPSSLSPLIGERIWNVAALTYSHVGNDAQIFEIRNKVTCTGDAEKFQKMVKKESIFYFLVGLNTEYDQIPVQVLGKTQFYSLHETYSYVQQEESRRIVMLYNPPIEKAGLITNQDGLSGGKSNKDHLTCDYCGKPQHTKDSCWKLHGRPARGRGGKGEGNSLSKANLSDSVTTEDKSTDAGSFTLDEI
ncbi:ankyrin repeat domain-containing protein 2b [Gossypium australe]|uniref:Ankyrin repeat domain-containing protein 2b n=1 Tax=Gossypium australe TaxID=47621 RepID=A0A5B6WSK8_9ROSI|nr:ankyrin repeat domain-containing protein 2b [Gossypium australe]